MQPAAGTGKVPAFARHTAPEGILFRQVLERAAKANRLRCVASPLMKKMGRAEVRLAALRR